MSGYTFIKKTNCFQEIEKKIPQNGPKDPPKVTLSRVEHVVKNIFSAVTVRVIQKHLYQMYKKGLNVSQETEEHTSKCPKIPQNGSQQKRINCEIFSKRCLSE